MIGAREDIQGKQEVRQKICHLQQMNPWREQISQWKIGFKRPV